MTAMRLRVLGFMALLAVARLSPVNAQYCVGRTIPYPDAPTFFVPLHVAQVPGANGSIWSSELVVYNAGTTLVQLFDSCVLSGCSHHNVPPGDTKVIPAWYHGVPEPDVFPGYFLSVLDGSGAIAFNHRVYDETQADNNWGTHVPVVRWDLLEPGPIHFINVPILPSARHTLRVYTIEGATPLAVRYFDQASGTLLATVLATSNGGKCGPGYLQLEAPAAIASPAMVRIQIQSLRTGTPTPASHVIWGLVSVTDAASRQVTLFPSQHQND